MVTVKGVAEEVGVMLDVPGEGLVTRAARGAGTTRTTEEGEVGAEAGGEERNVERVGIILVLTARRGQ